MSLASPSKIDVKSSALVCVLRPSLGSWSLSRSGVTSLMKWKYATSKHRTKLMEEEHHRTTGRIHSKFGRNLTGESLSKIEIYKP